MQPGKKPLRTLSITQEEAQRCIDALFRIGNVSVKLRAVRKDAEAINAGDMSNAMLFTAGVIEPLLPLDADQKLQHKLALFRQYAPQFLEAAPADLNRIMDEAIAELFETKRILMVMSERYMTI